MPRLVTWMAPLVHRMIFIGIHMVPGDVHMAPEVLWMCKKTLRCVSFCPQLLLFAHLGRFLSLPHPSGTEMIRWRIVLVALLKENPSRGVAGKMIVLMGRSDSPAEGGGERPLSLRSGLKIGCHFYHPG